MKPDKYRRNLFLMSIDEKKSKQQFSNYFSHISN